jgi:hypothetical protein
MATQDATVSRGTVMPFLPFQSTNPTNLRNNDGAAACSGWRSADYKENYLGKWLVQVDAFDFFATPNSAGSAPAANATKGYRVDSFTVDPNPGSSPNGRLRDGTGNVGFVNAAGTAITTIPRTVTKYGYTGSGALKGVTGVMQRFLISGLIGDGMKFSAAQRNNAYVAGLHLRYGTIEQHWDRILRSTNGGNHLDGMQSLSGFGNDVVPLRAFTDYRTGTVIPAGTFAPLIQYVYFTSQGNAASFYQSSARAAGDPQFSGGVSYRCLYSGGNKGLLVSGLRHGASDCFFNKTDDPALPGKGRISPFEHDLRDTIDNVVWQGNKWDDGTAVPTSALVAVSSAQLLGGTGSDRGHYPAP